MTTSVDIGNVTLTYRGASGGVLALQGTSLNVRRGEFAAVVGPSGCGKSSLMKLVTGLVPPDTGDITIFGDKVRGPVKIAGMAFQNPNLLPWRKPKIVGDADIDAAGVILNREALIEGARAERTGRHCDGTVDRDHGSQWQATSFGN